MNRKRRLKKIFSRFRNKYLLASIFILVWLVFFDKNDIVSQVNMSKKLSQLKEERQYYISEIAKAKADTKELMTNPKNLEKFAREKYLMKKDNEDIFVIVEKKVTSSSNTTEE